MTSPSFSANAPSSVWFRVRPREKKKAVLHPIATVRLTLFILGRSIAFKGIDLRRTDSEGPLEMLAPEDSTIQWEHAINMKVSPVWEERSCTQEPVELRRTSMI
ncbi:hypothetical protein [Mycoplana sp. MJR14]|uniref:hypothetical protein n=1 Tax=Mycoplana sp. MJR14 TaxID=3032583 RepID=UPI0023DBCD5D|nr:hypothetical protein [Mycoplana sp. MJR14]MDF1631333.1 hypothetical protein [Mycoplana sp. MJR14]